MPAHATELTGARHLRGLSGSHHGRGARRLRAAAGALLAACCLALALGAPAQAQPTAMIGIADQHGETFGNPLFSALGIKDARLNLAWDVFQYPWQVQQLDAWMGQAQAAGVDPLVILSQSRVQGRTRMLPTPSQYGQVIAQLRARYPFVHEFAAWNEANHSGQPTYKRPDMVARYYKVLRANCPGCSILPASILDDKNMVTWTQQLRRAIRRLHAPDPRLWGLHNYSDVNNLRDTMTRRFIRAVKGKIWITESGGVVAATSPTASKFPQGADYAARVTSYILGPMLRRNPRIQRIYFYDWQASAGPVSWDSGLIAADGTPRPAYQVLESYQQQLGRAAVH
ncbi:MAG TPA: hypothetical protein VMT10_06505 [Solirubrobacteraceae bacterium]|nr:hypothetical protein [Solirubrobacteraceae bacterium]